MCSEGPTLVKSWAFVEKKSLLTEASLIFPKCNYLQSRSVKFQDTIIYIRMI